MLLRLCQAKVGNIFFSGDALFGRGIAWKFENERAHKELVRAVLDLTKGEKLIVNLEGVVRESCPPLNQLKTYELCIERDFLKPFIKELHIVAVGLANNHRYDYGYEGYEEMKRILREMGVRYFEEGEVVNFPEFNLVAFTDLDNLAVPRFGSLIEEDDLALLDTIWGSKPLVVMVHWGEEYTSGMFKRQEELLKEFWKRGVEVVIGSHSHKAGEYFCSGNGCAVYSLGNFIFDQDFENASGQLLKIVLDGEGKIDLQIIPHENFFRVIKRG